MGACPSRSVTQDTVFEGKPLPGSPASLAALQQAVIDALALFSPLAGLLPGQVAMTACAPARSCSPIADEQARLL